MKIKPFELERYFAKYEFSSPYLLSCSDCEPFKLTEVLEMADYECHNLWKNLTLAYTESSGHPLLKNEVARLYKSVESDDINIMAPEEGIYISMNCMLQKGDHVVTMFPGYQSLYEIATSLGCEVSQWQPDYKNGWHFDIKKLKSLIRKDTKLVVINFPHNPTGATISQAELKEIVTICKKQNITLFSDEMYRYLEYDNQTRLPSAVDLYEHAITLFGMSKSFALPGLRIGWLASKNKKLMQQIANFKDYTTICNNAPSEILSIIALRNKEAILKRNLNIISTNLDILDRFFDKQKRIFEWQRPVCSPIGFPLLKLKIHVKDFCENLVEKKGVMLLPATVFNFDGNYFRLGFGRKNMAEALSRLEEYIQESEETRIMD